MFKSMTGIPEVQVGQFLGCMEPIFDELHRMMPDAHHLGMENLVAIAKQLAVSPVSVEGQQSDHLDCKQEQVEPVGQFYTCIRGLSTDCDSTALMPLPEKRRASWQGALAQTSQTAWCPWPCCWAYMTR